MESLIERDKVVAKKGYVRGGGLGRDRPSGRGRRQHVLHLPAAAGAGYLTWKWFHYRAQTRHALLSGACAARDVAGTPRRARPTSSTLYRQEAGERRAALRMAPQLMTSRSAWSPFQR